MRRAKSAEVSLSRLLAAAAALVATLQAGPAAALEFSLLDEPLKVENLFALGASWRTQAVDPSLIGKSNLYAYTHPGRTGLCFTRTSQTPNQYPDTNLDNNQLEVGAIGRGCTTSAPAGTSTTIPSTENKTYVNAPGSFSPNGDNGDLNFKKGDIVHAVAKLTTDVNYSFKDYNVFVRGVAFFDANYSSFTETHYDTTLQASHSELNEPARRLVGVDYDILDYNIGHTFDIAGHDLAVKVGDQVVNWGESSLLALNSLNTINPPDSRRLNLPGLDLKEAFRPLGMVTMSTQVIEGYSIEGFYTYDWKPAVIDPPGTFFSQSDTLGDGGDYAMLSFGKQPEDGGFATSDPYYAKIGKRGFYRPVDTCYTPPGSAQPECVDSLGELGSTASRTVYRDHAEEKKREPDGGDYGAVLKMFFDSLNNGTEVSLYHANYDSRLPVVSAFASNATCIVGGNAASLVSNCGVSPGFPGTATQEPVPVDTMRLMVEYPKDIRLWGMSFNTTVGDYAVSGEYAFRENLPIQVDTVDLTYTALQPAFAASDTQVPGVLTIPGRRSAFPAFLTGYRGYACTSNADCIQPNQYIAGYERFKVGQANLTVLKLIGGDNPIGATQMTALLEMGMQKVFDMPALSTLQLEGTGSDTHISGGADGNPGIEPKGGANIDAALRQNPTPNTDYEAYGTSESYGFRFLNLNRWDDALFGVNLETLAIVRWDVKGTSPGIGTNFSDGRKQYNFGLRGDYLSRFNGEIRYTWFTGGHAHDGLRDRDNIQVYFGYSF